MSRYAVVDLDRLPLVWTDLIDSMPALDSIMVKPECKNCMYYVGHGMCSARPGPGSINECSYSACELWVWDDMHLAAAALDEHDKAIRKTFGYKDS